MTVPSRLYGFQTLDLLSATDKCFLAQPHQPGLMAMDKVDIAFLRKTKWHKRVQRGQKIWKHKCIGDISWYLPFPISPEAEMSFLFWPTAPPYETVFICSFHGKNIILYVHDTRHKKSLSLPVLENILFGAEAEARNQNRKLKVTLERSGKYTRAGLRSCNLWTLMV